jgi:hypothetical protein
MPFSPDKYVRPKGVSPEGNQPGDLEKSYQDTVARKLRLESALASWKNQGVNNDSEAVGLGQLILNTTEKIKKLDAEIQLYESRPQNARETKAAERAAKVAAAYEKNWGGGIKINLPSEKLEPDTENTPVDSEALHDWAEQARKLGSNFDVVRHRLGKQRPPGDTDRLAA